MTERDPEVKKILIEKFKSTDEVKTKNKENLKRILMELLDEFDHDVYNDDTKNKFLLLIKKSK